MAAVLGEGQVRDFPIQPIEVLVGKLSEFEPGLAPITGVIWVFVGSLEEKFAVEFQTLQKFQALASSIHVTSFGSEFAVFIKDDPSSFKLALRLAREAQLDPTLKRSRTALRKMLYVTRRYGLNDIEGALTDRYAISQNSVMPEIAAMLETNPRRKLLLMKSIVRKARLMDLMSGGTQGIPSKIARVKIAENLTDACEASTMSETWKRKYIRLAEKLLLEGRSADSLPQSVLDQMQSIQKKLAKLSSHSDEGITSAPKLLRSTSDSRRAYLEKKSSQKPISILAKPTKRFLPQNFCLVDCGGQREFTIHLNDLQRFGVFDLKTERSFLVFDDPGRFELALHLVRCDGRVDDDEKVDDTILKSYRNVVRSYNLDWVISRRLDAWISAHRNGAGGARNAREEIRALRLTRLLNPDRGDALVASALAEAYLERAMNENLAEEKKQRLLQKAETNLRVVLPVLLTSLSVVQVSKEQRAAIDQSVGVLKQVLAMQDRNSEAEALDAAVALFSKGIQGAAKELSNATRSVPSGMYA